MIRVRKRAKPPKELETIGYSSDSVKRVLFEDQKGKCYLCERETGPDIATEHLRSQSRHPELVNDWNNLFLSCSYCNSKKLNSFDDILDPSTNDVECEIFHFFDSSSGQFVFHATNPQNASASLTAILLGRLFNGTHPRMPTLREEVFRKEFIAAYTVFLRKINCWLTNRDAASSAAVQAELSSEAEYLGFKFWIINSSSELKDCFGCLLNWNREPCVHCLGEQSEANPHD